MPVESLVENVNPSAEQIDPRVEQVEVDIRAENNSFQAMMLSVPKESITREALKNIFGDKYMEGLGTPRLFVIQLQSQKAGYVVFHVHEVSNP